MVKGIVTAEDAVKAAESGASAVWVCPVDHLEVSPISLLKGIADALRTNYKDVEIFYQGGIRRGTDVLKALAFGATAVFLDEDTPLWGLFQDGKQGL